MSLKLYNVWLDITMDGGERAGFCHVALVNHSCDAVKLVRQQFKKLNPNRNFIIEEEEVWLK